MRWERSDSHTECLFDDPIRIVLQGRPDCLRLVSYSTNTKHILAISVGFKVLPRAISWYFPYIVLYKYDPFLNAFDLECPGEASLGRWAIETVFEVGSGSLT
jgi:hypothetical protein